MFEKVDFLHYHEELDIGNGTVIFSKRSSFRKANNFKIWPYLKLSIFSQQLVSPKLLYFGNPEDSGNGVRDFFAHKVMQILNIETVLESKQIWKFSFCACANYL